jgi:hypothetical protein
VWSLNFPADPVRVEIPDHRCCRRCERLSIVAIGDAAHAAERRLRLERRHERTSGLFAFAPDNGIDMGFLLQDLAPVIGGKYASIDDACRRQDARNRACHFRDDRMAGGRTGMSEQHGVRSQPHRCGHNFGCRHGAELGIEEMHDVAVVDERPSDAQQAERGQMIIRYATADRRVRHVDEKNAHAAGSGRARHLLGARACFTETAEAALATAKICDCGCEIIGAELRPHATGEAELGVGAFPQQKIRQSFLAAGADQEIDIAAPAARRAGDEAVHVFARGFDARPQR